MKKTICIFSSLAAVALLTVLILPSVPTSALAQPEEKKTWRLYTTVEGSFSHSVGMGLARVANKYNKNVELVITTGKGSVASNRLYEKNETDTTYCSNQALSAAWRNEGVFAKSPLKYRVYQGVYLFSADQFVITQAGRTDIKSLSDLAGKKMHPYFRGSGTYDTHKLVLSKLGIWDKVTDRQMGGDEVPDALITRRIDAVGGYTVGQATLPGWMKNVDLRVSVQVVNPSEKEKEIIKKIPSIVILPPMPASVFTKPVGVDKIWTYSTSYAWGFGPNEDTERVYGIVKAWYEHPDELLEVSKGFRQFAKLGLELNVRTIDSLPDIPVHPGVAKYLKERGVWKSTWKIGKLYPRP